MKKDKLLFQNGQSQTVRLPQEFRFECEEVIIKLTDNAVVLIPANHTWDILANSLIKFSDDFMNERNQPAEQNRKDLFAWN